MRNDSVYIEEIPARVKVALQLLDTMGNVPNQIETIAYDVIVKFLKEELDV